MISFPSGYAEDMDETIRVPISKKIPVIDGKFTSNSEWSDAKTINFASNGHGFYLQAKQDSDYLYLMFDGVDFTADPKDNSTSVRYQALVCFDSDGNPEKRTADFCLVQTVYNEFGREIQIRNAELKYTEDGLSEDQSMEHDYSSEWGFEHENDIFEQSDHPTYELKIPKETFQYDIFGFSFSMYFGSAHDDLVQLDDGVTWPTDSNKDVPLSWGGINLRELWTPVKQMRLGIPAYKIECKADLELAFKDQSTVACVRPETKAKLVERGWTRQVQFSTELSGNTILEMASLLESGQVSKFNDLRKGIVGVLVFEKINAAEVDLSGINLRETILSEADLHDSNLEGADLYDANIQFANLNGANLQGVNLYGADLNGADLRNVNFKDAFLQGVNLKNTDLREVDLQGANLTSTQMQTANMQGVNLSNADLRGAQMKGTNLEGANLYGAKLVGADLQGTIFKGAILENANFQDSFLFNTDLENADLKNANLENTGMHGTNLIAVKNLPISIEDAKKRGAVVE